jgi:hypothetical protein
MIRDDETFAGAKHKHGTSIRIYDDGFGPLWVYRESLGVLGIVRASNWHDAFECVLDAIMSDADVDDPSTYALSYDDKAEIGELAEGYHFRPNGIPTDNGLSSPIACEDLNGSFLDALTPEFLATLEIVLDITKD